MSPPSETEVGDFGGIDHVCIGVADGFPVVMEWAGVAAVAMRQAENAIGRIGFIVAFEDLEYFRDWMFHRRLKELETTAPAFLGAYDSSFAELVEDFG